MHVLPKGEFCSMMEQFPKVKKAVLVVARLRCAHLPLFARSELKHCCQQWLDTKQSHKGVPSADGFHFLPTVRLKRASLAPIPVKAQRMMGGERQGRDAVMLERMEDLTNDDVETFNRQHSVARTRNVTCAVTRSQAYIVSNPWSPLAQASPPHHHHATHASPYFRFVSLPQAAIRRATVVAAHALQCRQLPN